jgi:hypothetical protein
MHWAWLRGGKFRGHKTERQVRRVRGVRLKERERNRAKGSWRKESPYTGIPPRHPLGFNGFDQRRGVLQDLGVPLLHQIISRYIPPTSFYLRFSKLHCELSPLKKNTKFDPSMISLLFLPINLLCPP